jgi:hypothetical protein
VKPLHCTREPTNTGKLKCKKQRGTYLIVTTNAVAGIAAPDVVMITELAVVAPEEAAKFATFELAAAIEGVMKGEKNPLG